MLTLHSLHFRNFTATLNSSCIFYFFSIRIKRFREVNSFLFQIKIHQIIIFVFYRSVGFIFHPEDKFLRRWKILITLFAVFLCFLQTYVCAFTTGFGNLGYGSSDTMKIIFGFLYLIDILYIIDICIQTRIAVLNDSAKGKYVVWCRCFLEPARDRPNKKPVYPSLGVVNCNYLSVCTRQFWITIPQWADTFYNLLFILRYLLWHKGAFEELHEKKEHASWFHCSFPFGDFLHGCW